MKNVITVLVLISFIILSVTVFLNCFAFTPKNIIPVYAVVSTDSFSERINCWQKSDNEYYVFLPSYADLPSVKLYSNTNGYVSIDGKNFKECIELNRFQLDTDYNFEYVCFGRKSKKSIKFLRSENLPTIHIDTDSGNMDYIHAKKGNKEFADINLYNTDGSINYVGKGASVNGRGNSTWELFDKKPYSICLSEEADLLGMGSAKNWILLANASDASNIKNKLVYDFAETIGLKYSPHCEWVDVYLNDEYAGLYLLCEKNEVHKERVNVKGDGSFLVSLENINKLKKQNKPYIDLESGQALRIHSYSGNGELNRFWQSVENAIISPDSIDSATGKHLSEFIDLNSWATKYLLEEVFANFDSCYTSQYFYRTGESGKVYAGPVWDYDFSMGGLESGQINNPKAFIANRKKPLDGYETPWFYNLYIKEEFYDLAVNIYKTSLVPKLQYYIDNVIVVYKEKISKASCINNIRWFDAENDIDEQTKSISEYINKRMSFLNEVWVNNREYYTVRIDHGTGIYYSYYCGYVGECLDMLPPIKSTVDAEFKGWYYSNTHEPFDINKPIYEDTEIYAKWVDKNTKISKRIVKYSPIVVITGLFAVIFIIDIKRNWKRGVGGD